MTGSTKTRDNGNTNLNGQLMKDEEQQPEAESSDGAVKAVTAAEGEGGADVGAGTGGAGGVIGAEGAGGGEDNVGAASEGARVGVGEDGAGVTAGAGEGGEAAPVSAPATENGNKNGSNIAQSDVQNANQVATVPNGGGASPTVRTNGVSNGTEQLIHNPGISMDWTVEEQSILDEGLITFAGESSSMWRYIKIAKLLPEKTVRDVAMRVRWMTKKEMGKRRKPEDQNTNKKVKEKKEKADVASNKTQQNHGRPGVPTYVPPPLPDNDDGISNDAIGGETGQLLEQNQQLIKQIRANFATCKLNENCELLARYKDNIVAILNGMTNMPGIMSQMPPLPVKIDTDLAEEIFRQKVPLQSPSAS